MTSFDSDALNRFRFNDAATSEAMNRAVENSLNPFVESLNEEAEQIAADNGLPYEVAALWLYGKVKEGWDDQLLYRAALARRAGVPKTGIAEVLSWKGGAAPVIRRMPKLDELTEQYSEAKEEAEKSGETQEVRLPSGFSIWVQPGTD